MNQPIARAALAAALLAGGVAVAQETPKPELQPASIATTPVPAAGPSGVPSKLAAAVSRPQATVYGFVNLQFSRTDAPSPAVDTSTVELRRARIGVRGEVLPQVGYNVLFDAADTSLKDAYGVLRRLPVPGIELRAGQLKTPFGYEQQESDTKLLWVYSSYVVQALARSTTTSGLNATPDSRDIGGGVWGTWKLGGGVGADLESAVVNGAGPNRKDDLNEKNVWARGGLSATSPLGTFRAGASFGYGHQLAGLGANGKFDGVGTPVDDASFYFRTYGADATFDSRFVFVAAELIQSERDLWDRGAGTRRGFNARGWYAGAYGKTPWDVGPILRVEQYDRNRSAGNDLNERYTVGAYADLLPVNARLIFNYEIDRSDGPVRAGDRAILFGQVIF